MTLIQWNSNGFHDHKGELQYLIQNLNPTYIAMQETRLRSHQNAQLNGYTAHRKDRTTHNNANGDVAIFVKNTTHAEPLNIQTNLEAIAISIHIPEKIAILNIYLPPNIIIDKNDIDGLIKQIPKPFILTGDLNCHNFLW